MQLQSPACSNLRRMQKDVRAAVCKVKLFAVGENSIVDKRGGANPKTPPLPYYNALCSYSYTLSNGLNSA